MQLLIAHGDAASRLALRKLAPGAEDGALEVVESGDGMEAIEMLLAADSPSLALVDWDLPGCDGPELCRLVRAYHEAGPPYIILLARSNYPIADGLEAGADDCVHTPANAAELRARIKVGRRFAALPWQKALRAAAMAAERSADFDGLPDPVSVGRSAPDLDRRPVDDFDAAPVRGLDALRKTDDDERDRAAAGGGKFELTSLLVTQ